jgi:acetyl-CoA synthetase
MQHPVFPVPAPFAQSAHMTADQYEKNYQEASQNPDAFWGKIGKRLTWFAPYTKVKNASFTGDVAIKWYEDGTLNACYNAVDRHLPHKANHTALIFEGDDGTSYKVTYQELKDNVSRLANALITLGVKKGDRVTIYMPMICEAVYVMLACARLGAVHSVVFGGFSPQSLADRILDCDSSIVITANEGLRGGKKIPLKANVDQALLSCPAVTAVLVLKHTDANVPMLGGRDHDYHHLVMAQSTDCPCAIMNAEDPLFILYTSGSTGKPKGVLHTTGGYLVYASYTHEIVFDYKDGDIYWCTADVGWVTGHSYIVYGPLCNGATTLIFEGIPNYPDHSRFWQVIDKHRVTIFYTAPTAIRALLSQGDQWLTTTTRHSLRLLGSVGEPINEEAWLWYHDKIGGGRCPIVDTWWQTETGGILITSLPGAHVNKPAYAGLPFFGVEPLLLDANGAIITDMVAEGNLVLKSSWPGQMRTVYRDHDRFRQTYFSAYPGYYFTGDGAKRDADGYYRITGRVDDVINVSGHRFGTAEIEDAINAHAKVAESAVIGFHHDIKGQGIYAYVIPNAGAVVDDTTKKEIIALVREIIGPIASPDVIHFTNGLPKTRSGKIMRRILRKIADREFDALGDISTLADPQVVELLVTGRKAIA